MNETSGDYQLLLIIFGLALFFVLIIFRPRTKDDFLNIGRIFLTIIVLMGIAVVGLRIYDRYDGKGPLTSAEIDQLNLLSECQYDSECKLSPDEFGELKTLRKRRDEFGNLGGDQK
jgi:hypothetical protein